MSSAIAAANSLVDFKVIIRECYVSTFSKSKMKDKKDKKKRKFSGGTSKSTTNKGKIKPSSKQG